MKKDNWHNISWKKSVINVGSDYQKGLTEKEVEIRRKKFGKNILPKEKSLSNLRLFFEQFKNSLIYILIVAGIIVLILERFTDSIIIFIAVILNVFVSYFQESKASKTLQALKKIIKVKALVFRNNEEKEIFQEELVVGDIILLKPGMKVPADARLIENQGLKINESILTGEWLAAEKTLDILPKETPVLDRDNIVYMGTIVEDGWGKAVIVQTGIETEIGKIAQTLKETKEEKTPYQKKLAGFSKIVGIIVVFLCLIIFIEGIITGEDLVEMFIISVAVAVAAIPEGLPVAMSVILAVGMQRIFKKNGLVRKLVSAETLGSTSIIITDKTGTLTEAKMEVAGIFTASEENFSNNKKYSNLHILVLKIVSLCNEAFVENFSAPMEKWILRGDSMERALLWAGIQAGISRKEIEKKEPKIDFLPFDSLYKYSASLHKLDLKNNIIYAMGAPEKILELSKFFEFKGECKKISQKKLIEFQKKFEELTSKGIRLLAVGYKKIETEKNNKKIKQLFKEENLDKLEREKIYANFLKEMTFVGFIGLHDPIRNDAKDAIKICRQANMKPIIVTGDHKLTAKAVAQALDFEINDENILDGKDLEKMSEEEFKNKLEDIQIYARVEPQQKLRIVKAWQDIGRVVAMTGDGINDTPALKQANIGIAVGSGTDLAKQIADLVLLNDSFSVIVVAIEEGRRILDNIRKVITYLLSDSFTEVILIGASIIAGLPLPVTAAQILWVNLIEDGLPSIALAFESKEKDLMKRKPQDEKIPLLNREMKILIFIIGIVTDLILLGMFLWLFNRENNSLEHLRTMVFALLGIDSLFYVFSCKNLKKNIWQINLFDNKFLLIAWFVGFLALILGIYLPILNILLGTAPLLFFDWGIIISLGIINLFLIEASKWVLIKRGEV
ncbi:HAD-IC family P-type ATPase [Candidatus Wolfebacteria bacterium]|nr:HAD-IC family P-type ATPase [Candidatus Wolfebacteria bacterium]